MDGRYILDKGNVEEPEHDGTAEWNAFWDPEAVKTVFDSKIKIDMVALESTNQVPLTLDVRQRWADEREHVGIDFLGKLCCRASINTFRNELNLLFMGRTYNSLCR